MQDELDTPPRALNTPDLAPETVPRRRRRRWKLIVVLVLLAPILLIVLWTTLTMNFAYSTGERVGYVQKLSERGWLCKTWEGELALSNVPGQVPEKFYFSVRSDDVARQVLAMEGSRVVLHYRQHKGIPTSCFGETEYFVDGVRPAR